MMFGDEILLIWYLNTYHKLSYNGGPQVSFRLNRSYEKIKPQQLD